MDKLEHQVLQYEIAYESISAEYQAEYNKRVRGVAYTGIDPIGERNILVRLRPIGDKRTEAIRQRDQFKNMEICEDVEKQKALRAQTIASERITELEEQLQHYQQSLVVSGDELKLSEKELMTERAKQQTLTNKYFLVVAGIVLIGILLFRRRA